jgi:2-polyprenyl-6-hydroxyphenyl methylase/3-demethylubiquinone-9 3-methyltransferase
MHPLLRQFYQAVGLAYYHTFLGPRGRGRPAAASAWDSQYRTGHWDNFTTTAEMPRYAIIGAYIRSQPVAPSVLDVGCGYGQLVTHFEASSVRRYLGIDLSSAAIDRANLHARPNVSFAVGDFAGWRPDTTFDLIVFNDTLYYAKHPVDVLERFADMLEDGGSLIVAMYRHRNTMVIWKDIARRFASIDSVEVRNGKGELTDIRVLKPLRPPRPSHGDPDCDGPGAAMADGSPRAR